MNQAQMKVFWNRIDEIEASRSLTSAEKHSRVEALHFVFLSLGTDGSRNQEMFNSVSLRMKDTKTRFAAQIRKEN